MARPPNLNGFLYFETVARRGTITRAAEELGVSPSAVSQQIKALEQRFGVRLLRRKGRLLVLTLEGEQLFQTSTTALSMLRDAQGTLSPQHNTRLLSLRVSPSFGVRWLGPRLSGFVARHPEWDLRMDAAPDPTDFNLEMMDADIRYGRGDWPGLHAQPVLHDHVLPLCSPEYLAGLDKGNDPFQRLEQARLIHSAKAICQWNMWLGHNGVRGHTNRRAILMDRSSMALQLAVDGAGVVLESLALASSAVEQGRLVPVTPSVPVLSFPAYWLICPPRHLNRRAVRILLDWLEAEVATHALQIARILARHGLTVDESALGHD